MLLLHQDFLVIMKARIPIIEQSVFPLPLAIQRKFPQFVASVTYSFEQNLEAEKIHKVKPDFYSYLNKQQE